MAHLRRAMSKPIPTPADVRLLHTQRRDNAIQKARDFIDHIIVPALINMDGHQEVLINHGNEMSNAELVEIRRLLLDSGWVVTEVSYQDTMGISFSLRISSAEL